MSQWSLRHGWKSSISSSWRRTSSAAHHSERASSSTLSMSKSTDFAPSLQGTNSSTSRKTSKSIPEGDLTLVRTLSTLCERVISTTYSNPSHPLLASRQHKTRLGFCSHSLRQSVAAGHYTEHKVYRSIVSDGLLMV